MAQPIQGGHTTSPVCVCVCVRARAGKERRDEEGLEDKRAAEAAARIRMILYGIGIGRVGGRTQAGASGRSNKLCLNVCVKAISLPPTLNFVLNPHQRLVNEVTVVCQGEFTSWITEAANNVSNSFDQDGLEHPLSLAYPAIAPTSFPCHPGPSTLIDYHFESSLTEKQAYRWKGKESTKGGRRTY